MEWEKISANNISDKGLTFRKYKEILQLNNKITNNPILKMGKRPEQTFLQRKYKKDHKHGKMLNIIN